MLTNDSMANSNFNIGDKVQVSDERSWLYDKVGYVAGRNGSNHIIVDFEKYHDGWQKSTAGELKRRTHDCLGRLGRNTGYLFREHQLKLAKF